MTVNGGNEMKALLLKTSVWLVLLFSVMGLWQVSNAAEQHTPMKAHAVTTIDKATSTANKGSGSSFWQRSGNQRISISAGNS